MKLQKVHCVYNLDRQLAVWEIGGKLEKNGVGHVVADRNGRPKIPQYTETGQVLAALGQALLTVEISDYIISAYYSPSNVRVKVRQIAELEKLHDHGVATTRVMYTFQNGEWDLHPAQFIMAAVDAALKKAQCYKCKEPHFIMTH